MQREGRSCSLSPGRSLRTEEQGLRETGKQSLPPPIYMVPGTGERVAELSPPRICCSSVVGEPSVGCSFSRHPVCSHRYSSSVSKVSRGCWTLPHSAPMVWVCAWSVGLLAHLTEHAGLCTGATLSLSHVCQVSIWSVLEHTGALQSQHAA